MLRSMALRLPAIVHSLTGNFTCPPSTQNPEAPRAAGISFSHDSRWIAWSRSCDQTELDAIYLTGGSSALQPFQQALQAEFAGVTLVEGDLFGGVASGLAYSRG